MTDKKYAVIYADPPWPYNARNNHGTKFGGGVHAHYPILSMERIAAMRVGELAAENCALFLWCTFPHLERQLEIIRGWGFEYKTVGFTWMKTNPKNSKLFFGTGFYAKCLGPNSRVFIMNSRSGKVEYISLSELYKRDITDVMIHSHHGWKRILICQKNEKTKTKKIKTEIGEVIVSENHRLFYKRVSLPRIIKTEHKRSYVHVVEFDSIDTIEKMWKSHKKRGMGLNLLSPGMSVESSIPIREFDGFELTDEFAWIMGLFVAEGNYGRGSSRNQIRYSLCSDEMVFYEKIKNYVEGLKITQDRFYNLKVGVHIHKTKNQNAIAVYFSSVTVKRIFDRFIVGEGAHKKRLNIDLILQTSSSFRESFLRGILDGDGCLQKGKYQRMVLCNQGLIQDISLISFSVGLPNRISELVVKNQTGKEFKAFGISYKTSKKDLIHENVRMIPIEIRGFEDSGISDTYDLTVDGEAFVVDGILSHNSNAEVCLLATRGKMTPRSNSVSSAVLTPRREHSRKPDVVRERIAELFGDVPRIELFARQKVSGWDAWGFDVESDIEFEV